MVNSKQMNLCPGKSVGAIIRDGGNRFLCLYRKSYPMGLAFPAGHINVNRGERPFDAVCREVYEETSLVVWKAKLLLHEIFPNSCSRGYYSGHEWYVYEIVRWESEPRLMEPDKHDFVRFLSPGEIKKYLQDKNCDPAWFSYILPILALKIV